MDRELDIYMERCLQLAILGKTKVSPNPMVGAVLVYNDRIIGEGYHMQYGGPHAEVNCLNSVKEIDRHLISQSTIYVSLEPCAHFGKTPPCADLIIKNAIPKVVVGCRDPFDQVDGKGIEKLRQAGIEVEMSKLEKKCRNLNRRFFTFHLKKRPFIVLKWAQTADGFIGHDTDERLYISGQSTNIITHQWRSEEDAILIGTNTAVNDRPSLTTRNFPGKNPIRMLLDKKLVVAADAPIYNEESKTVVFNLKKNEVHSHVQFVKIDSETNILEAMLGFCYKNKIQSILVEGGKMLLESFLKRDLWDECRVITNVNLFVGTGVKAPQLPASKSRISHQTLGNDTINIFVKE